MFVVRKSTHDAVVAQRDEARASAEFFATENANLKKSRHSIRTSADMLAKALRKREQEVQQLRADLAASYVRNAKGQIVRHPSAAA